MLSLRCEIVETAIARSSILCSLCVFRCEMHVHSTITTTNTDEAILLHEHRISYQLYLKSERNVKHGFKNTRETSNISMVAP